MAGVSPDAKAFSPRVVNGFDVLGSFAPQHDQQAIAIMDGSSAWIPIPASIWADRCC
jgi:hypothetical protein